MSLKRKIIGIYKIENIINGKVYIGQAIDIHTRWTTHKNPSTWEKHPRKALYLAFKKYGIENFTFEVLEECNRDKLDELEVYYIRKFNSFHGAGYNMNEGGNGNKGYKPTEKQIAILKARRGKSHHCYGKKHTEEFKQLLSKLKSGENHHMYGKKHTEETKKKMSIASKKYNSKNQEKVICDGIIFNNITECANYYKDVNRKTMSDWLSGKNPMRKDYYDKGLRFLNKNTNIICSTGKAKGLDNKASKQIFFDGNIYDTLSECANAIGVPKQTLSAWVNGRVSVPMEVYNKGIYMIGSENKFIPRDSKVKKERNKENCSKKVICNNTIYNSIVECANHFDVNKSTMSDWLRGKSKMPQKFKDIGLAFYKETA